MITLLIYLLRRATRAVRIWLHSPDKLRRDEKPWPPGSRCPDVTITFEK